MTHEESLKKISESVERMISDPKSAGEVMEIALELASNACCAETYIRACVLLFQSYSTILVEEVQAAPDENDGLREVAKLLLSASKRGRSFASSKMLVIIPSKNKPTGPLN